jgi:hypothetical protein
MVMVVVMMKKMAVMMITHIHKRQSHNHEKLVGLDFFFFAFFKVKMN